MSVNTDQKIIKNKVGLLNLAEIVPLVKSDQIDKLGVAAHQSFAFWTRSNGAIRLPQRLVSDSCRPSIGDPRLAPSDRRAAALCQTPQAERRRPLSLGLAVLGLDRLGIARFHRQGHGDWLAS